MTTTMRCPDCGGEYLTGVELCFDCDVPLVPADAAERRADGTREGAEPAA